MLHVIVYCCLALVLSLFLLRLGPDLFFACTMGDYYSAHPCLEMQEKTNERCTTGKHIWQQAFRLYLIETHAL